jgi:hypothetical protein
MDPSAEVEVLPQPSVVGGASFIDCWCFRHRLLVEQPQIIYLIGFETQFLVQHFCFE